MWYHQQGEPGPENLFIPAMWAIVRFVIGFYLALAVAVYLCTRRSRELEKRPARLPERGWWNSGGR